MRSYFVPRILAALSFLLLPMLTQADVAPGRAANDPLVGEWKLNPSKSHLTDQMKVESVGGNRYAFDFGGGAETVTADGSDQAGLDGTTLAVTQEGSGSLKVVRKKDGHVLLTADWRLSKDGSALDDDFTSFAPDGTATNVKYVYKRATATSGFAGTWESTDAAVSFVLVLRIQPHDGGGLIFDYTASGTIKVLTFDGKDHPTTGPNAKPGTTFSARRTGKHSLEITDKLVGKLVDTQEFSLAPDLKTLTLAVHKPGTRFPSVLLFERQ